MYTQKIVNGICVSSKILLLSAALGIVNPVQAAGTWFIDVTVSRVMTSENQLQIWGNKGCGFQPGYGSQYATSMYSADSALLSRMQAIANTALSTGKSISFYADCDAALIEQMCVSNPEMNAYSC